MFVAGDASLLAVCNASSNAALTLTVTALSRAGLPLEAKEDSVLVICSSIPSWTRGDCKGKAVEKNCIAASTTLVPSGADSKESAMYNRDESYSREVQTGE